MNHSRQEWIDALKWKNAGMSTGRPLIHEKAQQLNMLMDGDPTYATANDV